MSGIFIGEISKKWDVSLKFWIEHNDGNFQEGISRKHPKALFGGFMEC
jgi:hypothetical protein